MATLDRCLADILALEIFLFLMFALAVTACEQHRKVGRTAGKAHRCLFGDAA